LKLLHQSQPNFVEW